MFGENKKNCNMPIGKKKRSFVLSSWYLIKINNLLFFSFSNVAFRLVVLFFICDLYVPAFGFVVSYSDVYTYTLNSYHMMLGLIIYRSLSAIKKTVESLRLEPQISFILRNHVFMRYTDGNRMGWKGHNSSSYDNCTAF